MRIVLDTNVLISAFLWQGAPKEIFVLAEKHTIAICATRETLEEFERVLSYPKFKTHLDLIGKTPTQITDEFAEIVEYYPSIKFSTPQIQDDPSDDNFLSCALSARASFIVSGDKHLLRLKRFRKIPILSPDEFLKKLNY